MSKKSAKNTKSCATSDVHTKNENNNSVNNVKPVIEQDKITQTFHDTITALCIALIYSLKNQVYSIMTYFCNQQTLSVIVIIGTVIDFFIKSAIVFYIFGLKYTILEFESKFKYFDSYQFSLKYVEDRFSFLEKRTNNQIEMINNNKNEIEQLENILNKIQNTIVDISNNIIKLNENNESKNDLKIHMRQLYNSFEILLSSEINQFKTKYNTKIDDIMLHVLELENDLMNSELLLSTKIEQTGTKLDKQIDDIEQIKTELNNQIDKVQFNHNEDYNELHQQVNELADNLFVFMNHVNKTITKIDNMLNDNIETMHEINNDNLIKVNSLVKDVEHKYNQIIDTVSNSKKLN